MEEQQKGKTEAEKSFDDLDKELARLTDLTMGYLRKTAFVRSQLAKEDELKDMGEPPRPDNPSALVLALRVFIERVSDLANEVLEATDHLDI